MMNRQPTGPLGKALALIGGLVLLAVGAVLSVAVLAVVAVIGLSVFGYVWWKTRALRKALREQAMNGMPPPARHDDPAAGEVIIEGEAVVIEDDSAKSCKALNDPD